MTCSTIISLLTLLFVTHAFGQARTLTGKVIDDQFQPFIQAKIFNADTVLLGKSNMSGSFSITIPQDTKTLIVADVGMEWKNLEISDSCSNLEIILLPSGTYDFMTEGKVDRLRRKQFDKLTALHKSAFEKGVFKSEKRCYVDKFISIRKRQKKIQKQREEMRKRRTQKPST
jgi:hypothetical protein